jgi:SPP1 gp7 family putative phage head morphogenesis protein
MDLAAAACDVGHPRHDEAGGFVERTSRRDTTVRDPHFSDPTDYESRTDWQKTLWRSRIDDEAKRYIKQLENTITDNWSVTFDGLWGTVEAALDRRLPLTDEVLAEYVRDSAKKQLRNLDLRVWESAFNGLYVRGKQQAYGVTGFDRDRGGRTAQVVVDTPEEHAVLRNLRETALQQVKSVTDRELRRKILERLTDPGATSENPTKMANEIIREERRRLEKSVEDRDKLKEQIKGLYDDQLWQIQRITRTETVNAYWIAQLTGYRDQGIEQIKFNSHTYDQKTCAICLALDGTAHDIDAILRQGGRYPLSTMTHPQCRCWPTPIIAHVTIESMEALYRDEPELFAPGQTVFDEREIGLEDVVKDHQTIEGTRVENLPVEHRDDVKEALGVIHETPYQQLQPQKLRFVVDVGEEEAFQKEVPLPQPILGQVTAWTSPARETLLSQWAAQDGQTVSSTILREWAGRIFDADQKVRDRMESFYGRAPEDVRPDDLQARTIAILTETFVPFTMMRRQLIGDAPSVALEKRLREAPDQKAREALERAGISPKDVDTIVKWRRDRPAWGLDGRYIQQDEQVGSAQNVFVNRVAERGAREMFSESCCAYVSDPWGLADRDPDLYDWLREHVFGHQEFKD